VTHSPLDWLGDKAMSDCPDLPTTAEGWEDRIKADFQKHPGSWRPDPENWYREGWLAGFNVRRSQLLTRLVCRDGDHEVSGGEQP
jgi:hypothetical protein